MERITLLINASKDSEITLFQKKLQELKVSEPVDILVICYKKLAINYPFILLEDHEDISFKQLLSSISTDKFLFFNPEINYPLDFFSQILSHNEKPLAQEQGSAWQNSLIALQQSNYGLFEQNTNAKKDYSFLNSSALYIKKEVETLNTDKLRVHPESPVELYQYATKKNLSIKLYSPKSKKIKYITNFTELMFNYQKLAQKKFRLFPALFVLFFIIFGIGAYFYSLMLLIFLVVMSVYLLAITLESFGISTIKKNGAIMPILLLLFPLVHLVYGIESLLTKIKKKA